MICLHQIQYLLSFHGCRISTQIILGNSKRCKSTSYVRKKLLAFILIRVLLKKRKYLAKTFPLGTFGKFFILLEFEVHTPFDVGLYKTIPLIINAFVSFTKTFFYLSMKTPHCSFQETIHQDLYNLILQLYVLFKVI